MDAIRTEHDPRYANIAEHLAAAGWCVHDEFLDGELTQRLARECRLLWQQGEMRRAAVGKGDDARIRDQVRRDLVRWVDPTTPTLGQHGWLHHLEQLRLALNRMLYLGLFEYEGHLAVYPAGAFYRRHLDRFQGSAERRISVVFYLNDAWTDDDGGQLRIYLDGDQATPFVDIAPVAGRLVTFVSDRFEHEVLAAKRPRMSLTGWYRTRPSGPGAILPERSA
ncbi:MAG: 2OG-Fe(II) oxygenase [Aquisalimonadaceae bacterium]